MKMRSDFYALYPLSYRSKVDRAGFEPATSSSIGITNLCRLASRNWCPRTDSNRRNAGV